MVLSHKHGVRSEDVYDLIREAKTVENEVEISFATCVLGHHLLNHLLKPRRVVWVTGDIYAIADGSAEPRSASTCLKKQSCRL